MRNIENILDEVKRKRLLVVYPHPDDESVWSAGIILRTIKRGFDVKVISVTNGIRGRINVHGRGRSVVEIRQEEMAKAMRVLGVTNFEVWDHNDGTLKSTEKWRAEVKNEINQFEPGLIVTYDHSGLSGHPDHIALALEVFGDLKRKKKTRLLWPSAEGKLRAFLQEKSKTIKFLCEPTIELKLGWNEAWKKWQALRAHSSQNLRPAMMWNWLFKTEYFGEADLGRVYDYKYVDFRI